ncbi:MAG TPA: SPFH domain-containing protein, partial [Sphingomicrobium sp.]|nr:SPFH domain-containing protein [Sphingomicrobium sp.]
MTDFIRRHPLGSGIAALALLFLLIASFPVVPETKQAVVVRFGNVERIYNRAGLAWRIPLIEDIVWIDKRVLDVDMDRQPVLSTDQRRLEVDAFARYRIVDPLRMYITAR